MASTMRLQIARPSPVPPLSRASWASPCWNGWNSSAWIPGAMPTPVSATAKCSRRPGPGDAATVADSVMRPRSVYFTALPSRLIRTWLSRSPSPDSIAGTSSAIASPISSRSAPGRPRAISIALSASARRSKSAVSITIRPASMRDRSRMSLMISSRWPAESSMMRT